jgi:hypothetical protein
MGRWGDGAKGRQIWWGEAPERSTGITKACSVIFRTGFTVPQNAPSRGLSWARLGASLGLARDRLGIARCPFGYLQRPFGSLAPPNLWPYRFLSPRTRE